MTDMYRGIHTAREIAVLAMHLPRGANIWIYFGGPQAVTADEENAWITHLLLQQLGYQAGGGKGEKPKIRPYPDGINELKERGAKAVRNAQAFRQKHLQN